MKIKITSGRFQKNTIWTIADYTVYPLLMITATPIFLNKLGAEQYGLWMLFNTIILFAIVFNFGIGDTTIRLIAESQQKDSTKGVEKVIEHNLSVAWIMLGGFSLLGFAIFGIGNLFSWQYLPGLESDIPFEILLPAAFSAGFKMIELVGLSYWKGMQRFDVASKFTLFGRGFIILCCLVLVLLGFSIFDILLATACLQGMIVSVHLIALKYQMPKLKLIPSKRAIDSAHFSYNYWYWMQTAIGASGFALDKFIVAFITDLATFGYYAIASMIGTQIHNLLTHLGSFVFPKSAGNQNNQKLLLRTFQLHSTVIQGIGWSICFAILVFGEWPLSLWLGDQYEKAALFIRFYICYEAILVLTIVPFQMINGSDAFKMNTLYELFFRTFQVSAMLVISYLYGASYVVHGLILGSILILPIQFYWLNKHILQQNWNIFLSELACLIPLIGLVFNTSFLSVFILTSTTAFLFLLLKMFPTFKTYISAPKHV